MYIMHRELCPTVEESPGNVFERHPEGHAADICRYIGDLAKDSALRRDYFAQMSPAQFISELQRLRQIMETGEIYEHPFNGRKVYCGILIPPHHDDKARLLEEAWSVVGQVLNNEDYSDQQALNYAGGIISTAIIAAHPFEDGNGRSARLWRYMVEIGGGDAIAAILSRYGGKFMSTLSISELNPFPIGTCKGYPGDPIRRRMGKYISQAEYVDSYHNDLYDNGDIAPPHIDEAPDLDTAQRWRDCDRKRRVAQYLTFLDLAKENPRLPLSENLKEDIARRIAPYESLSVPLSVEGATGYIEPYIADMIYRRNILVAQLGEDYLDDGKEYPILDQLVAFQQSLSQYYYV